MKTKNYRNLSIAKLLIITLFSGLTMVTCKTEKATDPKPATTTEEAGALKPVSFAVSGFSLSTEPMDGKARASLKATALKDNIKYLYYYVFNYEPDPYGKITYRKTKVQQSYFATFGTINDTLPAGRYKVYFFGAQKEGELAFKFKSSGGFDGQNPIFYYKDGGVFESFSKTVDLNVVKEVDTAVVLKRANSKVTVKLQDALPANAATVKLVFGDFTTGFDLRTDAGETRGHFDGDLYPSQTFTYPVTPADIGKTGFTVEKLVWDYTYYGITVECYDNSGKLLASRTLPGTYEGLPLSIKILKNTNHVFVGKLFENKEKFNVTVNTEWNDPVTTPF